MVWFRFILRPAIDCYNVLYDSTAKMFDLIGWQVEDMTCALGNVCYGLTVAAHPSVTPLTDKLASLWLARLHNEQVCDHINNVLYYGGRLIH